MDGDADVVLGTNAKGMRRERRGAAMFDLIIVQFVVSGLIVLTGAENSVGQRWAGPILVAILATTEWLTGASPGKLVTGLTVTSIDGSRLAPWQAVVRRPWALPVVLSPWLPTNGIVPLVWLAIGLAMLITTDRDAQGRGFHDRMAGTLVSPMEHPQLVRRVVVGTAIALGVVTLIADFTRQSNVVA